jgi:hypothetical protein
MMAGLIVPACLIAISAAIFTFSSLMAIWLLIEQKWIYMETLNIWHHCGVIQKAPSMRGFAICTLRPGHFGAHYDAPMKASWDELRFVRMVGSTR